MIKTKQLLTSALLALSFLTEATCLRAQESNTGKGNLKYIDPRIGNVGALLQPTRPTVQLPNQMIRMYPQRADYIDDQILNFPLTIVSHRLGEVFSIKTSVKPITTDAWRQKQAYDHDLEVTRPWYYSTYLLDDETSIEFTAAEKAGMYRFNFSPGTANKSILLGLYNNGPGSWKFTDGKEVTATETYHDIKVYMYGMFSTAGKVGTAIGNELSAKSAVEGKGVKAYLSFTKNSTDQIVFRYAISYISIEQANKNFDREVKGKTFEEIKTKGQKAWASSIDKITVKGGTDAQKRSFYTAYYRCHERMVDITEDNKYFSGYDNRIHDSKRPFYVDDWAWDTYLALHPLINILNPIMEDDMLNSYVNQYEQSGWMPTFPVLFGDNPCMNGFHSSIMILDGYRKGRRNFDIQKAYDGMLKNATQATMLPWRNGDKTTLDDFYYKNGFFPGLKPNELETIAAVHQFEKRQSVAVTLGASYDDWAVGQLAKELSKTSDYKFFNDRSSNYKNLWNKDVKLFMPKDSSGNWIMIDPKFAGGKGGRSYYDENNGWTYLWQVQHDIGGLIGLMGGQGPFKAKLDQLFHEPLDRSKHDFWAKFPDATGLVGQYSMGNEPSFHIPYLYNYAGAPWKTQERIRLLLDLWFKDNVFGIPGDEDGGGMSAFVVFSSMGFYPITPGTPVYTIGSPVFEKVTIKLPEGKKFTMVAKNCSAINKYIQSARFNGKMLNIPSFTHTQLMDGGKLELIMGPKPNKSWGTGS